MVLSSTPGSGDMRDKFEDSLVPIVNWEEAISDNGAGEFGLSSAVMTKSTTTTEIEMGDTQSPRGCLRRWCCSMRLGRRRSAPLRSSPA